MNITVPGAERRASAAMILELKEGLTLNLTADLLHCGHWLQIAGWLNIGLWSLTAWVQVLLPPLTLDRLGASVFLSVQWDSSHLCLMDGLF